MTTFAQWRAYLGPPWLPTSDASYWDWSTLATGGTPSLIADNTLSATLSDGATSLTLTSATAFPTAGHLWVGPNGTGQGWESLRYTGKSTNTLSGLVREPAGDREHNGVHNSGAVARFWWPLTQNHGSLRLNEEMDDALVATLWSAQIGGVRVPRGALRSRHLVLVQWRQSAAGTWANLLVGWLESPQARDDFRRMGEWSARVVSSQWLLSRIWAAGVRVGDLDMAKHATGTGASQTLVDVDGERLSGDFAAAAPSVGADNVTDREPGSVWIDERLIGTPDPAGSNGDPTPGMASGMRFTGAYLNPPVGARGGRRWIEVTATEDDQGMHDMTLESANGASVNVQWNIPDTGTLDQGDTAIFCEDVAVFEAEHPLSEHSFITGNAGFFTHVLAAGGEFALRYPPTDDWTSMMSWGHKNGGLKQADDNEPPDWPGTTITAPAAGQTMRYVFAPGGSPSTAAAYWRTDMVQHAGYRVSTTPDPWIMVSLPGLGLSLRSDITAGTPGAGAWLQLADGADLSTAGLPASGTLLVGLEQISYSQRSKTALLVSARGAGGTTAAAHASGDSVRLYDSLSGLFVDCYDLTSVGWRRYGGTIYPKSFRLRMSALDSPRTPEDADFANDWTQYSAPTTHATSSWTYGLSPARRVRHILFQFEEMTSNPARARLNEIFAVANEASFDASLVMAASSTAAQVAAKLLTNAGMPAGAWSATAGTAVVNGVTTAHDTVWAVVSDMADFARMRVTTERDSKLAGAPDPYWTVAGGSLTASRTWTRTNAAAVEQVWAAAEPVSQVEINWHTPDNATSGVVRYPEPAGTDGDVLRIDEAVYATSGAALAAATRLYFLRRYPWTLLVECAEGDDAVRPGDIHAVQWQMDSEQALPGALVRLGIVIGVEHTVEDGHWSTVITLAEIERVSGA